MEIRENPFVTQLAIARPNPFYPSKSKKQHKHPNIKENPMLVGLRNDDASSVSRSSRQGGFSESSEDLARRENIRRALSQLDDSSFESRENPKVRRRGASKTRAFSAGGTRGRKAISSASEAGILDTDDIKKIAEQVRKLRKEYLVSQSPSVKKRLDRAVAKLEQLSEYVDKDLKKLESASALLAVNPAKGGKMRTTRKTASARKPAKKRASVSAFKSLLSEIKGKKTTKRKTSKARKNPLDSALMGLDFDQESEILENPRRKSRKTSAKKSTARKSTARKSTARKSTARKNAAALDGLMGLMNPKRKSRKTTAKKSSARKSTLARRKSSARKNAVALDGLMGLMNPKRKSRKTTAKKSTARKSTARKSTARKSTLARRKVSSRKNPLGVTRMREVLGTTVSNPKRKSRKTTAKKSSARKSTARRSSLARRKVSSRKNPLGVTRALPVSINPKKRKTRKASVKRVAVKRRSTRARLNPLSRSVSEALRHFGHDFLTIHRGGKNITIKVNKSSAEYKSAKSKGLSGRFSALKGKKNTPYSLNVRSVHALAHGTPSIAEIQKALNAWAGAFEGGHIKGAKANPKRKSKVSVKRRTSSLKRVKASSKRKSRKSAVRKNSTIANPKRKKRSTSKVHAKRRTASKVVARKRSVAKKHHRKSSKRKSHGFKPMGMALMHRHNPAMGGLNFVGNYMRGNPAESVGMGTKIGYGIVGFTASLVASNVVAGFVDNLAFKKEEFESTSKIATDIATHAALGIGSYFLYQNSSKNEEMNSLFVGLASGIIGSALARNVSPISNFIAGIPGLGSAMRFIGGENSFVSKEEKTKSDLGRFLSENPLETMSGYSLGAYGSDSLDFESSNYIVDRYAGMGKYVPDHGDPEDRSSSDATRIAQAQVKFITEGLGGYDFEDADLYGNAGYDDIESYDFDSDGLGKFVPDHGDPEDRSSSDATRIAQAQVSLTNDQFLTQGLGNMSRHHYHNPMGSILLTDPSTVYGKAQAGFSGLGDPRQLGAYGLGDPRQLGAYGSAPAQATDIMSNQAASAIAPTRTTATGVDIKSLVSELKDIDSLDNEELRQEGIPDVASLDVAVVRATPYFARQIAESNLGYMLAPSSIVKGTYLVGLYVGPESLLANTGMGARDVSVPMGVRNARPAGIFTSTVFSSIIPSADGGPIWSGGEFGDM